MAAARYIELNPVRAKLCRAPWRWRWSSAAAHAAGKDDVLVRVGPLLEQAGEDWRDFLLGGTSPDDAELIRGHERTGRPLWAEGFVERLERLLGRSLRRGKPGPKPKKVAHKKRRAGR